MLKPTKYTLVALALVVVYFGAARNAIADQFVILTASNTFLTATPGATVHIGTSATNLTTQSFMIEDRLVFSQGVGILLIFQGYVLDPAPLPLTGAALATIPCEVFDFYVSPNAAPGIYTGDITIFGHLADGTSFLDRIPVGVTVVAPSAVPEPATMLLFGTGLAGGAAMYRRRRRQH